MPELPEVETVRRGLAREVAGRRIVEAEVLWPGSVAAPEAAQFAARLASQRVLGVCRRGKYLALRLEGEEWLVAHLRMTGNLTVCAPSEPAGSFLRARFCLDDGRELRFTDIRKFGRLWLVEGRQLSDLPPLRGLGPEPLDPAFTPARLHAMLRARGRALKPLLLDQSFLAGLGNIYVDEALYRARLHPLCPSSAVGPRQATALHAAIQAVLVQAIQNCGSSLENFRDVFGNEGRAQLHLDAYQRTDQPCPRCGCPIARIVVAQRGTHYCPRCQRLQVVGRKS